MARRFNISGELTQVLLAAGTNENVRKISLTNVQKVSKCKVDLYIEKALTGKFYLLKGVELPIGATLEKDLTFDNSAGEYGLYIKLTDGASFTITGSINPDGSNPADGEDSTVFLSELSVGDQLVVNGVTRGITALISDTAVTMGTAFGAGSKDTTVECNPKALVDVILS
tara:strand:- start:740 stop:1249 length:510 start_codon:yes stop_codon:yes gene_type:complete